MRDNEAYMKLSKRLTVIFLILIFLGAFLTRMYRFDNPVADWHSWRQADTAAVTRNFVKEGYTPFFPKFDALNSLNERQEPNPKRYFFAEFPIYNSIVYFGYSAFGQLSIEEWGRLISIIASSLSAVILYFLVREYSGKRIGLISSFVFAFLPYNIYYGRVIMPDPLHIFFSLLSLYLITLWVKNKKILFAVLSGVVFAGAILTKPYGLVLLLPISYLIIKNFGFSFFKKAGVYIFYVVSLAPLILWRTHINAHPEGMFGTTWLYNAGDIRFTGAYFRWLIFERMNRLIFATGGFVLFFLGLIQGIIRRGEEFYYLWLFSIIVFFVIIAKGNVTHDYYQLPLVPIGSVFIAKGVDFLWGYGKNWYTKLFNKGVAVTLLILMLAFGWFETRDFFNINRPEIVEAGVVTDKFLPKDAKVIAPYQNDSAFLYQTNRYGFTQGEGKIPDWLDEGATHMVSVNFDDATNYWADHCETVKRTEKWIILDMTTCNVDDYGSDPSE